MAALLALAGCGGGLSWRSDVPALGDVQIPVGTARVRIEARSGSLTITAGPEGRLRYRGACLRAADTEAELRRLEAAASAFTIAPDPAHPEVLVVAAPALPRDVDPLRTVLAIEATFELPAALPIEVHEEVSGHLTVLGREAAVVLDTARGDLKLIRCRGPAVARTGGGDTIVDQHEGDLEIDARAGEVHAWVKQPGEKLSVRTGSGNIQVHIPATTGFHLDGRAEQGKGGAGAFGIQGVQVGDFGVALVGDHGDGRTRIVLRTGVGHLSVRPHTFD